MIFNFDCNMFKNDYFLAKRPSGCFSPHAHSCAFWAFFRHAEGLCPTQR